MNQHAPSPLPLEPELVQAPPAAPGTVMTLHPQAVATAPAAQQTTPMMLLTMAMNQGADLDRLERLMDMHERWEAREARNAFNAAMAAFKANPPDLHKNKTVDFSTSRGRTTYDHATLDEVALKIGAAMAPHGLSFRWNVEQTPKVRVTCLLQHVLGHTEQVVMEGPADDSGNKNAIQQVGSTVTYLERYTLLAITGMAVKDQDDDGRGGASQGRPPAGTGTGQGQAQRQQQPEPMSEETFQAHLKLIREAPNAAKLQEVYKAAYRAAGTDQPTLKAFVEEKDRRKAALQAGGAQ